MFKLEPKQIVGSIWDDGGKSEIVQILVSHETKKINALQFAYVEEEQVRHSEIHGKTDGSKFNMVTLDYPSEFLTSVSGAYDGYGELTVIAFGSNKRMYGPFGMTNAGDPPEFELASYGNKFNYEFGPRSCFAGFHGSVHNSRVNAIGIYLKPIASLAELNPIKSLAEPKLVEPFLKLDPSESLAELNIK